MRTNRRELPTLVTCTSSPLYSSTTLKSEDATLTVYHCKKNKNVTILSTMHQSVGIANNEKKTPETIQFYNETKFGVDVFDQMTRKYSVKASSRRWPVQVFYNVLDMAAINSWILFRESTGSKMSRRSFILQLVQELRQEHMSRRSERAATSDDRLASGRSQLVAGHKRRQCQIEKCRNKTVDQCSKCHKHVCGTCAAGMIKTVVCKNC